MITLGTTFLHGYDVIFDRENNKIGFVESDCKKEFNYTNINNKKVVVKNKEENVIKKINSNLIFSSSKGSSPHNIVEIDIKGGKKLSSLLIFIIIIIVIIIAITLFYYFVKSNRRFKKKRKINIDKLAFYLFSFFAFKLK